MADPKHVCPVCMSSDLDFMMEISNIPIYCNRLWNTYDEAIHAQRGNIRLTFCRQCGHVFNAAFDPDLLEYTQDYENSLHFSPHFQKYAEDLARRLVNDYNLHHKTIIEIGCGKGDFLMMLCVAGENRAFGFDPSYEPDRVERKIDGSLSIINDYYSEKYASYQADLICCRHVLEHIHQPKTFLDGLRRTVDGNLRTILFFEVPNVMFTLRDMGIWDLIYEHCGYFSSTSLGYLFNACGFQVIKIAETFGDQFLNIDACPSENSKADFIRTEETLKEMVGYVSSFSKKHHDKVIEWRNTLEEMESKDEKVVIWGAGSKGVTFLNMLSIRDRIEYAVDINPHKENKHIPGTGQKVVQPDFLKRYQPDTVVAVNPIYKGEIKHMLHDLGVYPKLIFL